MLERFLSAVFDEEHQFQDLWELKLIKFDIDIDNDRKSYEKHLSVSSFVEDMKGYPGQKGNFFITNLRIMWHGLQDKDLNLSIGLDTITYVALKSYPQQGFHDLKHVLVVKALSPGQTKYEFKFAGYRPTEERIFKKVEEIFRKFSQTKYFRNIDTSPKLISGQYRPIEGEEFKTRYEGCTFVQDNRPKPAILILTDIRLVIIHQASGITNYGIPWIMLERFIKTDYNSKEALQLHIRGLLKDVELFISCANRSDFSKMHKEIVSFSQTYNKNPTLGMDYSSLEEKIDPASSKFIEKQEIDQFVQTKVNIGRRKYPYGNMNQKGSIKDTFFNDELGIMMERLPQGYTRNDLWSILKP